MCAIVHWVLDLPPALSLPLTMILQPLIQDEASSITTHCHEILSVFTACSPSWLWLSNSLKPQSLSGWNIILSHYSLETELFCEILTVLEYTLTYS